MAFQAGKAAVVLIDQYDLSAYFNAIDLHSMVETPEMTTFGANSKTRVPTLKDGDLNVKGFFDADTVNNNRVDDVLRVAIGTATNNNVSACPIGDTIGNIVRLVAANEANYAIHDPVAGVVEISSNFKPMAVVGVENGISLHSRSAAETSSTNSTSVDNTAGTTNGLVAHLHVIAEGGTAGPTATIKVQHSTDNTTWVDLITFTAATGVTTQRSSVTGTVNRYLRVISTITGTNPTFTYAVTAARR